MATIPSESRPAVGTRHGFDGVTGLCVFVVLLFALPSAYTIAPLGSMGAPATLMALVAFLWWVWHQLNRTDDSEHGRQPLRWAIFLLLAAVLAAYIGAMSRPIAADEISPADGAVLRMLGLCGIALVANEGIRTTDRMAVLIRCLIGVVSAVAVLSVVQFVTGQSWIDRLSIPGLTPGVQFGLEERQAFSRSTGTASHPIEFAAVLSMVLPLAIMHAKSRPQVRFVHLVPVALIVLAAALSLSRTAILCVVVGLVVILPALPRIWRVWGVIGSVIMAAVFYVAVPGFVGTLRGLFVGLGDNPSVQSRTGAYDVAMQYFLSQPVFGRGLGTFLPKYWIFDKAYLQLLIEIGLVGLAAVLGLFLTALISGLVSRNRLERPDDRDLALGVVAGVAAGAASFALFDALSFPQAGFCLFLLIGMCGAYWRLAGQHARRLTPPGE